MYLHQAWSSNGRVTYTHCSPDLDTMTVMCRPFYLPREITAVLVTAVYGAPDALEVKAAKTDCKRKVENRLADNDPRQVWQGLQQLTNYRGNTPDVANADASLVEELNQFFTRFETKSSHFATPTRHSPPPPDEDPQHLPETGHRDGKL